MIRALIFLALWAALPTPGQVGSVALYTQYQNTPSVAVARAMQEEVGTLLTPGGFRFEWRSLPVQKNEVWTELAVLTFTGQCKVLPAAYNSQPDNRLGWTHISDGAVLPFAEVDCDAIRALILKNLLELPPESREAVFGRAAGRVVAHELLHVFAKTTHHGSHGVDQPAFSVPELLADRLVFDSRGQDFHILRAGRAPQSKAVAASPQAGRASYVRNGCANCHGGTGQGTKLGPVLRVAGRTLSAAMLAAKLTKSERKMCQRAQSLKVAAPSLAEEDLSDVLSFLNETGQ
jgi:cytochrome c553